MADQISERDDITLRIVALIEDTTVAEQRRQAVRDYCEQARKDETVARIVRLVLASRRKRQAHRAGGNVITLRRRADG